MEQFPHLNFIQKLEGKPRFQGGSGTSPQTLLNKKNRLNHSSKLQRWVTKSKNDWDTDYYSREQNKLADIDINIKPIFLQINPEIINNEFNLESFGIEIISEEENGFIIGASLDNFRTLEEKINGFITSERGSGKIADFWQIIDGHREVWKPELILSEALFNKWKEIDDDTLYKLEVSIAFNKPMPKEPSPNIRGYEKKLANYNQLLIEHDDLCMQRETDFENFIKYYGKITSEIVLLEDSFGCEVEISGKGLKDLVINYQFVFEVSEIENISGIEGGESNIDELDVEIVPPNPNSPEVGVIDSGIMEENKFIAPAINKEESRSYLPNNTSTTDQVRRGGHGTKVAGAILYPNGISQISEPYQLPCFIRNLRVLDENNQLTHSYPAELTKRIVKKNKDCKIFNLSISSYSPYRKRHMSSWAALIDTMCHEENVLFIIASGNIRFNDIEFFLNNGKPYPDYLHESYCGIANPAHSSFGITVGSINHTEFEDEYWKSLGNKYEIAPYSRIGTGIWGHIKPDVVEFGGGIVFSKNGSVAIKEHEETATELIRSTLNGGNAFGKDSVGTSFAAPKVTHIAARLKQLYPDEGVNLLRALIVQGARLPEVHFNNPSEKSIQYFGYGLPELKRVTSNTEHRVTFYNTANICAEEGHLYSLQIPEELRNQGDEYEILIEVTLSYTAKVRRTRQKTKSYLSSWLDWNSSKVGESFESFRDYALKEINNEITEYDSKKRSYLTNFDWKIKSRSDHGVIQNINRNNSTLQKDWTIIKSYDLPENLSFIVKAHKGWDKNKTPIPYAITVSLEILGKNVPIYHSIRIVNEIEIEV